MESCGDGTIEYLNCGGDYTRLHMFCESIIIQDKMLKEIQRQLTLI